MKYLLHYLKYITPPVIIAGICVICKIYNTLFYSISDEDSTSEVIFFTGANVSCRRNCIQRKISCGIECTIEKLNRITDLISSAKVSLDVCIYLITNSELSHAILHAYKRGIQVRIIIDEEMSSSTESKLPWFIGAGIPVKSKKCYQLTHHKFCIVDTKKLLTGSLNWTLQGLAGNYESVTITSNPIAVTEYQNEFNNLWISFDIKN